MLVFIHQALGLKLANHLVIFDPRIGLNLVIGQQFLPRRRQILIGRQYGNQRAHRYFTLDHQITANREEEERRELGQQIVQELNKEFFVVDLKTNMEDRAQALREISQFVLRCVVGMNFLNAGNRFANLLGQPAHFAHPRFAQQIHFLLQPRDDPALNRIEQDRRHAHHRILGEDVKNRRYQQAALERRHGEGVADKAAERLDLGGNHRNQLALAHFAEMRQRKAQDTRIQQKPEAPQHALAHTAFIDVDIHLKAAVNQHQKQENDAQRPQQGQLFHVHYFDAENLQRARKLIADNGRIVDL